MLANNADPIGSWRSPPTFSLKLLSAKETVMGNVEVISNLVNFSIGTARFGTISVELEVGTRVLNRSQAHLLIRAPFDSLKSALLHKIAAQWADELVVYDTITEAGLLGSVEKRGTATCPAAWAVRNRVLLLDEFNVDGKGACTKSLLGMLEGRAHTKKIGFETVVPVNEEDGDLFWRVDNRGIHLKTRFACIIASMHNISQNRSLDVAALVSRCIYFEYHLTPEQKDRISEGHDVFGLNGMKLKPPKKTGKNAPRSFVVPNSEFKHIKEVIAVVAGSEHPPNWFRLVDNCLRYYCYNGEKHDDRFYGLLTRLSLANESMKCDWNVKEVL